MIFRVSYSSFGLIFFISFFVIGVVGVSLCQAVYFGFLWTRNTELAGFDFRRYMACPCFEPFGSDFSEKLLHFQKKIPSIINRKNHEFPQKSFQSL
jgi:hypothetical protein